MGKKRDQLCTQMKNYILSSHTTSHAWDHGSGAGLKALISKVRLIIIHTVNSTLNLLYSTQSSHCSNNRFLIINKSCRSQWPRGLRRGSAAARLLRSCVRTHRRHGCLSVVSIVCCQVEVSATSRPLVQRSSTDCGASLCVI